MAAIGSTSPAIAMNWLDGPLVLSLEPDRMVLLARPVSGAVLGWCTWCCAHSRSAETHRAKVSPRSE